MPRISTLCVLALVSLKILLAMASSTCSDGAGGAYSCTNTMTNQDHALAACESTYGNGHCSLGFCGYFHYYHYAEDYSCSMNKADLSYEFIYENTGFTQVGADYDLTFIEFGQGTADVTGNR